VNGSPALFVERGPLVRDALVAGVSIADAAREHGVSPATVKGWLRRGLGRSCGLPAVWGPALPSF